MMCFFSISKTAAAFGDGILSKKEGYHISSNIASVSNIYDGDTSTYADILKGQSITIEFDHPYNIERIKGDVLRKSGLAAGMFIQMYNEKGDRIYRASFQAEYDENINIDDVKKVIFLVEAGPGKIINEIEFYGSTEIYKPVKSLSSSVTHDSVSLSWINPDSIEFEGVEVYEGDKFIKKIKSPKNNVEISGLNSNTEYTFKVYANYLDGGKSVERTITVRTDREPIEEVRNIQIEANHDRVNLSWKLPEYNGFEHVNVYRDEIKQTSAISEFFLGSTAYAASTKIFETNGTYFNDLTVKPKTTYEYTLTTTDGTEESEGVTVQATTPKAPLDEVGGVESEKQENGDYLFKWTSPTKGEVQIYVGGKKYKKVSASDGQILIPKEDLKFTAFGDPDVHLQSIDEDGEEGSIISPGGNIETPFTPSDLIETGSGLLKLIGPFVLLALSFIFVPKLIQLIRNANGSKEGKNTRKERVERNNSARETRATREYRRERTT